MQVFKIIFVVVKRFGSPLPIPSCTSSLYSLCLLIWVWFPDQSSPLFCSCIYFNPPDNILTAPSVSQKRLSSILDTHMFNLLLENLSTAGRARLLSVSSAHASSWLSVVPSQGMGLHLDPPVHQVAIGLDTSQGFQCALCPDNALDPLGYHDTTCKCGGDVVARHHPMGCTG